MLDKLVWGYIAVAIVLFVTLVAVGHIRKRNALGNGMHLSIFNALLLSAIWPITAIVTFAGVCYGAVRIWRKI